MYRAVEATRDILPGEIERWQFVEGTAREIFRRYGFREIRTPIFEFTELFTRSVGEETDIVAKEMYTFTDRGQRSLTLRPEGTAPTVRAYVEHKIHKNEDLTRWFYAGPMFRYERKQRGRYRQFSQIGAEVLGTDAPEVDAEVIEMVMGFLGGLGIPGTVLHLNSMGCVQCRGGFRDALTAALKPSIQSYCGDCQRRFGENVLRVLDCKVDRSRVQELPSMVDHLCDGCAEHFRRVKAALSDAGVPFRLEPHLVRGLDYYTRTAFEVTAEGLGAQNAVLGGGRYDGLVAQLGGPDVPGFGFAIGLDRLIMLLPEDQGAARGDDVHVIVVGSEAMAAAREVTRDLRRAGLWVGLAPEVRSVKAQMRRADRSGARFAAILGADEVKEGRVTLRRLADGLETSHGAGDLGPLIEEVLNARD